ncbi:MAG: hypothetical protein KTR31_08775 [Myxococcales bacterium]|nr:hypothetical protein [Myxococcales bacterium]
MGEQVGGGRFVATILCLCVSLACAGLGSPLAPVMLQSGDQPRTALVHVPFWVSTPAPLVIVLPSDATSPSPDALASWQPLFGQDTVLAFPTGVSVGFPDRDAAFLRTLVDHLDEQVGIDRNRVLLAGTGASGPVAWYASCFDARTYAAFAVAGASMNAELRERCAPAIKRPLIHLAAPDVETRRWLLDSRQCGDFPTARPRLATGPEQWRHGESFACRTTPAVEIWSCDDDCAELPTTELIVDYWTRLGALP